MTWKVTPQGDANFYFVSDKTRWVASIQFNGELTTEKQEELIKVIAAAPETFRALEELLHQIDVYEFVEDFDKEDSEFCDLVEKAKRLLIKIKKGE